ncbi:uncharacterized protein LOC123537530 [Mercenaria mercenaria]|uniref:uncharacterized protein LOC123537530 n=1 Tax=Mercenaria mercenaria TaxID=6596 RepID=UPI00234E55FC|nr:uncharacterized protein LOC123537530 [Mercenaria mercenaria]
MLKLLLISCICYSSAHSSVLRRVGSFDVKHPAFTSLYKDSSVSDQSENYNLIVSTFAGPSLFGGGDNVQLVRRVGSFMKNVNGIVPEVLTTSVTWPNEISAVPDGIFSEKMLVIPDGFLVPLKTNGAIKLVDITNGANRGPYTLTSKDSAGDWFYHRVQWHDMDGDGDQDIVTCRAREPAVPLLFGREDEELIWLENPSGDYRSKWNTHVLAHGPDVYFRFAKMNTADGLKECIFTAQFFTSSISVYWTTQSNGLFTDTNQIQSRVIDNTIGKVFEVDIADLNNDGKMDLLVTTNGHNGTLLAYEIPDDFRTGKFVKHTIDVGFKPRQSGIGKGAPGSAIAVQPNVNVANIKPVILLSGDDDGRAYSYEAQSQDPTDWSYTKTTFCDAGSGTVGELSAADVDNDGFTDVFVPSYSKNEVIAYTFAPADDNQLGALG